MIYIVIAGFNQSKFLANCLKSVREHTTDDYILVYVDNGSDEEEFFKIKSELAKQKTMLIRNKKNLGFVKAVNQALQEIKETGDAEYIVLLNNDTEVSKDWIEKLKQPLRENQKVIASGPYTNVLSSWQGAVTRTPWFLEMKKNKTPYKILSTNKMLAFFCTMFKAKGMFKVGLLDELYGAGLGDDDDYCRRIHQKGYRIAFCANCFIHHYHRTTFKALYSENEIKLMQNQNMKKYYEKWGKLQGKVVKIKNKDETRKD